MGEKWATLREGDGPWLIRSHYWNRWHRKSADGGACGYTDDILSAGVFGFDKARAYHDPHGRDEAIPVSRALSEMEEKLARMAAEQAALADHISQVRRSMVIAQALTPESTHDQP